MKKCILIFGIFICANWSAQKVKVLNFATFHMVYTPDKHKVKFDQNDEKNKSETYEVAKMLAQFKPTIICVEIVPERNEELNNDYSGFLKDKAYKTKIGGEVALIAYEVGKMSGVKKIYGIDEQATAAYNYNIGNELKNQVDSLTSKNYVKGLYKEFATMEKLSTLDKLKTFNSKESLEKFININADILIYNSTKGNFEGADEASKFYRRNLRIFSNLNQIPVTKDDRIFIIMGATHTAFLNEFMKRSPKYELVNTADYLK
ncbi:DUF5694 domain-containing protein [Elizabethkingia ursingii]|jgi:hypothetical protein|uniref:Uncharacterized protein n=1 Tax=Elizabethkingia ursingii TaxID=1756150 RepID=A0AAJ3TN13_9FLAO|nr:DUF5694 domain-containing protein [Elizabethkingia ursingii]AQX07958.1 hypothetical protein BBD34_04560 [Elizabethkingia ursingii]OPB73689.1 hypothetical protein BAY32_11665 [Elizabethkingia ursingii]OPB88717.1 hypothetical protein BB021_04880 [Elizabethkingia ursingii]